MSKKVSLKSVRLPTRAAKDMASHLRKSQNGIKQYAWLELAVLNQIGRDNTRK